MCYLTCYQQDLLYEQLFYAITTELFIRLAPHWWTDVVPYQQHISYAYRTRPLISLSFPVVLSVYPSYTLCLLTDTTSLSHSFCVFHHSFFPSEIWTSNLYLFSDPTSPCKPYFLIDTLGSWHGIDSWPHEFCWKHGLSWVWLSFMAKFISQHRHRWQWRKGASLLPHTCWCLTILTSSTLSFSSGALTNIPHQFLMHSHMVVLFFFRYRNKKNFIPADIFTYAGEAFGSINWWSKRIKHFFRMGPITRYWPEADLMADV